ncbi:hypothetical protein TNCV_4852661 [Trichonephila clavipes]|nr:hypothetical protein TNCV_4852661 [Trichonephila clavipes]
MQIPMMKMYAAPGSPSPEMRNITRIICSYLVVHSDGETNNKMDDIKQFVDNLMLKNNAKKNIRQSGMCSGEFSQAEHLTRKSENLCFHL